MNNIGLICVTHDPNGNNLAYIKKYTYRFKKLYTNMYITVSEESNRQVVEELKSNGYRVKTIPKKGAAHARREALKFALSGNDSHYHYCDFDRLMTWVEKSELELSKLGEAITNCDYLILGRTKRALSTHPIEWIETEKIANKIFSIELGQEVDVTAGSCGFSRKSAELILNYSKDEMTDSEWPMIVHRIGKMEINYLAVDGLEYREDLNGSTRKIGMSDDWFSRLKLCYIISESAMRTGKEYV